MSDRFVYINAPKNRQPSLLSRAVRPTDFANAYRKAQVGEPGLLFQILEFFAGLDDEVTSSMQSLIAAVTSAGLTFTPDEQSGEKGKRQAELIEQVFKKLKISEHLEDLLWNHFYGIRALYTPDEAWHTDSFDGTQLQVPSYLEVVPNYWIYASKIGTRNALHIGDTPLHELPSGTVLLAKARSIPQHSDVNFTTFGRGIGCLRHAIFKYYSEEDWSAFLEIFAQPLIIGKVGPGGDPKTVEQAVINIGHNSRAVIGENDSIEFPNVVGNNGESFDARISRANKAIAKHLKSESLTDNMGKSGSYAASITTNGIRLDVAQKLATKLENLIHEQFVVPLCEMNFGSCDIKTSLPVRAAEDHVSMIRVHKELNTMIDLSAAQLRKIYKVQEPLDETDIIRKRSNSFLG